MFVLCVVSKDRWQNAGQLGQATKYDGSTNRIHKDLKKNPYGVELESGPRTSQKLQ
jgi:hypothetical protein